MLRKEQGAFKLSAAPMKLGWLVEKVFICLNKGLKNGRDTYKAM